MSGMRRDPRFWQPKPPNPPTYTGDLTRMTRQTMSFDPETPRLAQIASPWRYSTRNKVGKAMFIGFWLAVIVIVSLIIWLFVDNNTEDTRLTQSIMVLPLMVALLLINASKVEEARPLMVSLLASLVALVIIGSINWRRISGFNVTEYTVLILGTFITLYTFTKAINLEMKK